MEAIERDRKQEEQEQKLLETLGLTFWTKPDSTNNNKTAAKRNRIQKANGGRMKMSIDDENCNCCEELLSNYYMAFCDR